jgi:predicted dehydrogenase
MSKINLNIGLIGCGHLGSIHAKLIKSITGVNNAVRFAGVYDITADKAAKTAKEYDVKAFISFEEMIKEIDTLVIVTPTSTHFEIAKAALKNNINLFIEKPVTSSLADAESLIKLSEGSKVKIQVGHVERFNPALLSLNKYELKPLFIESHRLSQFNPRGTDVSVIQDLMIHDIDIILNLVNSPVEKIDANGVAVISHNIDIANARLKFQNGCVANVTASRISLKKMRKMRIFQNNAYISIDFSTNKSEIFRLTDETIPFEGMSFPLGEGKKIIFEEPKMDNTEEINPIRNELESFFDSIMNDKPVKVTLKDGKQAVEVADKIIKIISQTDSIAK